MKHYPPSPPPTIRPECGTVFGADRVRALLPQYLGRYIYVWSIPDRNGSSGCWMFPTAVSGGFAEVFRWRENCWQLVRLDLRRVDSFY